MAARRSPPRKKGATHRREKGAASPQVVEDGLRWMPEVSSTGELFLRRREVEGDGAAPGTMNYPFAQGLTFVARRWRNLMNEELRAVGQSQARWGTLYWI